MKTTASVRRTIRVFAVTDGAVAAVCRLAGRDMPSSPRRTEGMLGFLGLAGQ
jgi:hypothetical protein